MRPNIRIQIENDSTPMDVDDNEDGEIADSDVEEVVPLEVDTQKQEVNLRNKLEERARRFQLPENERFESKVASLYNSLGIKSSDSPNHRFGSIHLHGIDSMKLIDIKNYFDHYRPTLIEWIDNDSCNIVFDNRQMSTLALLELSRAIKGVPVREHVEFDDSISTVVDESDYTEVDVADVSEITGYIPPGYWRLGRKQSKSGALLMRFGLNSDKLPSKTEPFGWLKNAHGQRAHGIFSRNKHMKASESTNPWSTLALKWDEDRQFRERERREDLDEDEEEEESPPVRAAVPKVAASLKGRLGKRKTETDSEEVDVNPERERSKVPRMRMYADDEEAQIKKKKLLETIDRQINKIDAKPDLREMLSSRGRNVAAAQEEEEIDDVYEEPIRRRPVLLPRRQELVFKVRGDPPARLEKPRSKVAVVVKKQARPTVASTVFSRIARAESDSDRDVSEESEEEDEAGSAESSEDDSLVATSAVTSKVTRPFFNASNSRLTAKSNPLKIEINNDRFLDRN